MAQFSVKRKKNVLYMLWGVFLVTNIAYSFEFDNRFLSGHNPEGVDLSAFSGEFDRLQGQYIASISINGQRLYDDKKITFNNLDGNNKDNNVCFTKTLLSELPLKKGYIKALERRETDETRSASEDQEHCFDLQDLDENILVSFDSMEQSLYIDVPQLYLENIDTNWVAPAERDNGVSGLFADYSLLLNHTKYGNRTKDSVTSNGVIGANIGKLRIRGNYQYDSKSYGDDKFQWSERYAFLDVASLNSKLSFGEIYTRSNTFDNTRIKGVSFYTDENMMPSYLQGYAPEITGVASGNAIVTVRQNGSLIRSVQVLAGPFAISDLPSYINGVVDVTIEEANGSKYEYQVDIAHVPFLTRKNALRYAVNIGELKPLFRGKVGTNVVMGDLSYGLTNTVSVFAGAQFTTNSAYRALNIGIGSDLGIFGAVSFDITQSENKADSQKKLTGVSYRFNYAKKFNSFTTLNLVGYRFSSRDYTTLNNYIDMKLSNNTMIGLLEKNRVTVSLSQKIDIIDSNISVSVNKSSYWNQKASSSYNIGLSKYIRSGFLKNGIVQFTFMNGKNYRDRRESRYGVFVSLPLGDSYSDRVQYSANYSTGLNDQVSQRASYDTQLLDGSFNVGVSTANKRDFSGSIDYALDTSFTRDYSMGKMRLMANHGVGGKYKNTALSAGFDGSITITQHGIATHQKVYENGSRLILDVGASDVALSSSNLNRSNYFGMLGVSNIPSYYRTTYKINTTNLPNEVEISDSVVQVAVSEGAIAYRSLNAIQGGKALSTISLLDGSYPPFGAIVYRENGKDREVGMVAEKGLTYLTGLNKKATFVVKWGVASECTVRIDSLEDEALQNLVCYTE